MLKRLESVVDGRRVRRWHRVGGSRGRRRGGKHISHTDRWKRLRLEVFDRDGYECQGARCQVLSPVRRLVRLSTPGVKGNAVCDHIVPIWQGGDEWDKKNLQTLCVSCHIEKTKIENRLYRQRYGVWGVDVYTTRAKGAKAVGEKQLGFDKFFDELMG